MRNVVFLVIALSIQFKTFAQSSLLHDTTCNFLKSVKFKNGIDTIVVKATYSEFFESAYNGLIELLEKERKLNYLEYFNRKDIGSAFAFIPANCVKPVGGPLSRKVWDKTYISKAKNIDDYVKEVIDFNQLKEGQIVYVKCIVYDDEQFKYNGNYFFTVIEIDPL